MKEPVIEVKFLAEGKSFLELLKYIIQQSKNKK